ETLTRGKSLGKLAMGLRVVSDDGGPERFRQALVRALVGVLEFWVLSGIPALLTSLLSAKGKRLGDMLAGTFVIQERLPGRKALAAPLATVPPALVGWASTLQLSGLTDATAETARGYLSRLHELTPAAREEFGQRIAATAAAQVSPLPPPGTTPADYLTAILAERRAREHARIMAQGFSAAGQGAWAAAQPFPGSQPSPGSQHSPGPPEPPTEQPGAPAAPRPPGFHPPARGRGESVDLGTGRRQGQPRHLIIDGRGHAVPPWPQRAVLTGQPAEHECLPGEGHVHDRGRVALRGDQVHDPAAGQEQQPTTIGEQVLVRVRADITVYLDRHVSERAQVHLNIEMPRVAQDRAVPHQRHVL